MDNLWKESFKKLSPEVLREVPAEVGVETGSRSKLKLIDPWKTSDGHAWSFFRLDFESAFGSATESDCFLKQKSLSPTNADKEIILHARISIQE